MAEVPDRLLHLAEQRGWKARIVPIGRLGDLEREIRHRYERGLLHDRLYHEQLSFFSFQRPEILPNARHSTNCRKRPQPNCEACGSMKTTGSCVGTCHCSSTGRPRARQRGGAAVPIRIGNPFDQYSQSFRATGKKLGRAGHG